MIVTLGVNGSGRMKSQLMQILNTKSCFWTNFLWVIYMCYQCKLICEYMMLVSIIRWTVFPSSFWKGGRTPQCILFSTKYTHQGVLARFQPFQFSRKPQYFLHTTCPAGFEPTTSPSHVTFFTIAPRTHLCLYSIFFHHILY